MKLTKLFLFSSLIFLLPSFVFAYQRLQTDIELQDGFSISPIKYDLQLKAGTKTVKEIFITNRSQDILNFQISAEDFIGSYNSEEQIEFLGERSSGSFSLKDWIKPEINNFLLQPGEQIRFNVEINIPENTETGSRYAVLFAQAQTVGAGQVQALSRLGTLFLIKVDGGPARTTVQSGGPVLMTGDARLKLLSLEKNKQKSLLALWRGLPDLKVIFENNYQTHLVPSGKITIFNLFHKKVAEIPISSWYILPESAREKVVDLSTSPLGGPEKFFFGPYSAVAEFFWQNPVTGADNKDTKKISFWLIWPGGGIISWQNILLLIILVMIIFTLIIFKKRRRLLSLLLLAVFGIIFAIHSVNAVMTSENYKIMKDSINVGGTEEGYSTNYGLSETIGETSGDFMGANYNVYAGYRVSTEYSLSISTPSNVTMSSCTNSASGCTSDGSVSWTVTTGYPNGYTLSLSASGVVAMRSSSGSFPDFSPTSGTTSFWSVDSYGSAFGFSIGSTGQTDMVSAFKDDGNSCGAGSNIGRCFRGFNGTNSIQVVSRSSAAASGNATAVNLKAEVGKNYNQPAGAYSAAITATVAAL